MNTTRSLLLGLCGTLAVLNSDAVRAQTASPQPTGETKNTVRMTPAEGGAAKADKPVRLSWGLDEIVKLSQAKLDESVILAFIENSPTAYNPTAQDLVQLRELGVSSQVITALMRHGGALRQAARESQEQLQAERTAAVTAGGTTAAAQSSEVSQTTTTSAAPVSTVTYIGYPRYYSYPSYSYGWYAPGYYYPRYSAYNCYPQFSFGIHFGGGYHGRYHGWGRHGR